MALAISANFRDLKVDIRFKSYNPSHENYLLVVIESSKADRVMPKYEIK